MSDSSVNCATHGQTQETFVCEHIALTVNGGVGFNYFREVDNTRPAAWCDECELIRSAYNGWNPECEKLTKIVLLCGGCYDGFRALNRETDLGPCSAE